MSRKIPPPEQAMMEFGLEVDKRCNKCREVKPATEFTKDASQWDGMMPRCRTCNVAAVTAWAQANPERTRERLLKWHEDHPDYAREKSRELYWRDPEKAREANRRWMDANRERRREIVRNSRFLHAEENRRRSREYARDRDPEARREAQRAWRRENPDKVKADMERRKASADPDVLPYIAILEGDPCAYCGGPMEHIDHIDPLAKGGTNTWDNLTAACKSCNLSKNARSLLYFLAVR